MEKTIHLVQQTLTLPVMPSRTFHRYCFIMLEYSIVNHKGYKEEKNPNYFAC